MSSPSPSRNGSDDLDDVFQAMQEDSSARPPHKRAHTMVDSGDDNDGKDTAPIPSGTANPNVAAAVMRFVDHKHLRGEQKMDVQVFLNDPPSVHEGKSYTQALHLNNLIAKIILATPLWVNIYSYAAAILLSTKLSAYKGNTPKKILYAILKKHCFNLPDGVERNVANWAKVQKAAQDTFTQPRSKFKKAIKVSFLLKNKKPAPKPEQKNIFQLTQLIVEGTQCEANVLLCARVAFMRKSFTKDSSTRFWDTVDEDLAKIHNKSNGDSKKIIRAMEVTNICSAFRHILEKDRSTYGVNDFELDEAVDGFQQEVDEMIDANATAPGAGEGLGVNEGEGGDED
ncbi:hypothetical protein C8J57DRAFT_1540666 [Mycena rebaudengoi]|nr:hypothetical protein C8J57DRAFT_1540666 [Mycena rebaudengoi]